MLLARRIWNWCRRFRYRCGYGVHSPSDFFLITSVIYEELPYYAYDKLKKSSFPESLPHYREKINKLLFRLVNYFRPVSLIEVEEGSEKSICYMREANALMRSVCLKGEDKDETLNQLNVALEKMKQVGFLHIGYTSHYKEVFEMVYPYLQTQSCVVVGHIYESEDRKTWWNQLLADERVRISFDLYDIGLLLFEEKRFKQNYIVNFF